MAKNKKKSKKDKSQKEEIFSVPDSVTISDGDFSTSGNDFPAGSETTSSTDDEDSYVSEYGFSADSETSSACGNVSSAENYFSTGREEFPAAVIDASFFASAVLGGEGEKSAEAQKFIQSIIERNGQFFVPQIFWFEIGNVLLGAAKKRKDGSPPRITTKQLSDIFMLISDLPFSTDFQPDSETRLRTLMLAQSGNLTYYDASYLELAHRNDIVLKTWDDALQVAATKE